MESFDTTSITNSFYEANKENFLLKEPIFRFRYISFPLDNVVRKQITRRFIRYNVEDVRFLDSLSFQFSSYFLSDTIWLNEIEVGEQLNNLNQKQKELFLNSSNYFEVKDSLDIYLFKLAERLERGNIAPISYVENTIRDILFNQKKLELLRSFDNDVLQDAIKSRKFEKY